ncbi:succinyldiaminopimelate transaminase [Litoribrevibacter albus]|uniref:Succinyldiaminopimelate transaminase n=1 Tax=Litoribrevibacter albus TaxID=1473156 RepID=A0AA37W5F9_9GAMM|nr:succinyldiaminopimelate transaminase [Litoribrevibacter albus]GLQ31182.1 succinyldiaminopimelate transaminase [Litoribrevibacter albus]
MNPDLDKLQPYPFEKLAKLKEGITPPADKKHIALSIGEPKHPAPQFVLDTLVNALPEMERYPSTKGLPELREAIANWLIQRFKLNQCDAETQVLPVNGTREAIFAFTQAAIDRTASNPLVVSPNPFYQIYEGAAYLSGATPHFLPCLEDHHFIPDFSQVEERVWNDCQILFLCSPGNPTGSVIPSSTLEQLIELSDKHNFIIASDECYSEIYTDEANKPTGLLEVCAQIGRDDFKNCVVFHSLSKRSNLPGLRSGFIAGDQDILKNFLLYRTYHGCSMGIHTQLASIAAWNDEEHVLENRRQYKQKFKQVLEVLSPVMDIEQTDASFYLWPKTPINEEEFAQRLFAEENITVLPGSYLSRTVDGINPGEGRIRMALVAEVDECLEAAQRIRSLIERLNKS